MKESASVPGDCVSMCLAMCYSLPMCMLSFHFHYPVKEIWLNLFSKEATEEVGDLFNITQLVRSLSLGLNPFIPAVPPARPATSRIWKPFTPSLCFREALWVGIIMMKTTLELKAAFVAAAYDLARFIWLCLCNRAFLNRCTSDLTWGIACMSFVAL